MDSIVFAAGFALALALPVFDRVEPPAEDDANPAPVAVAQSTVEGPAP